MDLSIGDLIQELRKDHGLTQSQLGQLLGVGYGAIHGYESGKSLPSLDSLVLLADYFDLNTDYLLGRTKMRISWKEFSRPIETSNGNYFIPDIADRLHGLNMHDRTALLLLLDSLSTNEKQKKG